MAIMKPHSGMSPLERRQFEILQRLGEVGGLINSLYGEAARLGAEAEELGVLGDGVRSLSQYFAWNLGLSAGNAGQLARVAHRLSDGELPKTLGLFEDGLLSLDQVGPVAARIPDGEEADAHFAALAPLLLVSQIRKAVRHTVPADEAPRDRDDPDPDDKPRPREISFGHRDDGTWGANINASTVDGAHFETGLRAHMDALMLDHKEALRHLGEDDPQPAVPTWFDALDRMVEYSLGREASARPHSQRTKTIMHVDANTGHAALHLGPALSAAERALLSCDGTIELVMERHGIPVSVGREHRIVPDKTRLLIEQRDQGCAVPGCGGCGKLVAHHIIHWEDGGPTDTWNLICLCPQHHTVVTAVRVAQPEQRADGGSDIEGARAGGDHDARAHDLVTARDQERDRLGRRVAVVAGDRVRPRVLVAETPALPAEGHQITGLRPQPQVGGIVR
jgi:hypothetical protein